MIRRPPSQAGDTRHHGGDALCPGRSHLNFVTAKWNRRLGVNGPRCPPRPFSSLAFVSQLPSRTLSKISGQRASPFVCSPCRTSRPCLFCLSAFAYLAPSDFRTFVQVPERSRAISEPRHFLAHSLTVVGQRVPGSYQGSPTRARGYHRLGPGHVHHHSLPAASPVVLSEHH